MTPMSLFLNLAPSRTETLNKTIVMVHHIQSNTEKRVHFKVTVSVKL
jgi:hypothetical protein